MKTDQTIYDIENDVNGITCILGCFKRPHTLQEQINAIESQTVKPREIWIVQDDNRFEISQEIKSKYKVFQCSKNVGVRFRFTVALIARTKYVCIFDDDTICGKKRLENCLTESKKKRGVYGTIGLRMGETTRQGAKGWGPQETRKERYYSHKRIGRANPNEKTEEVDIIGHSRFFERERLGEYFKSVPMPQFRFCGEDMNLNFTAQKLGFKSYIPPHPKNDLEMRGSKKGREYGTKQSTRAEHNPGDDDGYTIYYKWLRQQGFKVMKDR